MDDEDLKKLRIDLHKTYMEEFNRRESASSDNYDKAILAYSTGALALSVTFISTVVKEMSYAHTVWSLKVAWIAWILAIALTITSFLVSIRAGRVEAEKASDYYIKEDEKAFQRQNVWAKWVTKITIAAGAMFALGAIFMMVFVWVNLDMDEGVAMTLKKDAGEHLTYSGEGLPPTLISQVPSHKGPPPVKIASAPASSSSAPAPALSPMPQK